MKPTLLILAAGMGSRYGGLKQMDGVGPAGETIMDYSVYDALQAGFGKAVFVIREHFRKDFTEKVVSKYLPYIPVELVVQELDKLPRGFRPDPAREKPWGTAHAMLMAADVIDTPFAVINADDYYGRHSFETLAGFLKSCSGKTGRYSMVGFHLDKTLSENGGVSRGICSADAELFLTGVEEHHEIEEKDGTITAKGSDGSLRTLDGNAYTSMNMWGFTPDIFEYSETLFADFLRQNEKDLKKEFYIPFVVNRVIETGLTSVKILSTPDKWFGITYKEDRPAVTAKLKEMGDAGFYPVPLFK